MSRRRQRVPLAPDSDDDEIIRASAPASLHDPVSRAAHPERRSRMFSVDESRQWRRDRLPFGLPDFFTGIGPFLAAFFPGAHADSPLPRSLVERMQLMRPEVSSADKQHLIDATTIVCTHTSADELQCGICLQSLDQGAQLRMAQYVERFWCLKHAHSCDNFLHVLPQISRRLSHRVVQSNPFVFPISCTAHIHFCSRILTVPSAALSCLK